MKFEWHDDKAASNLAKHGVPFELAARVFDDPNAVTVDTTRKVDGESRRKCVGLVDGRLLVVVFHWRGDVRRIISARRTNKQEEKVYGTGSNDV